MAKKDIILLAKKRRHLYLLEKLKAGKVLSARELGELNKLESGGPKHDHDAYVKEHHRAQKISANNVYNDIPQVRKHLKEYRRGKKDLRFFLEFYFPQAFNLEWSPDHISLISKLERIIMHGGLLAIAMPRGSGKTTIFLGAAMWSMLYGYRKFVCLISATKNTNDLLVGGLKATLLYNDRLHESFPLETLPFKLLENNSHKQRHQRYGEEDDTAPLTNIGWGPDELIFANIPKSNCAGYKISARSIEGAIRGQAHYLPDGSVIRPDLVLVDDPQDRDSAKSPSQTKYRLDILNGDVLYLAGPGVKMSGMLACTVVYENDLAHQILDRKKNPDWQGEKVAALKSKPAKMELWDKYCQIRSESLLQDGDGSEATDFYRQNREVMDEGAQVYWDARFNPDEISALQHIMNVYYRDHEAFAAEYQNEPIAKQEEEVLLKPAQVMEKLNGRKQYEIPLKCQYLTMFVDVHDALLFYVVCGWEEDFTGYVVDYGAYPQQKRLDYTLKSAQTTLSMVYRGMTVDAAIQKGLEDLVKAYLAKEWQRSGGALMKINQVFVDSGYKPGIIENVRHIIGSTMFASRGLSITASKKPISAYQKKPGELIGHNWYIPNVSKTREFPYVGIDVNWWKTFVHQHLAMGSLTLWGNSGAQHRLFAEHIANSETFVITTGNGRTVREWKHKPSRPDNHWFDGLVGCAAAASKCGAKVAGEVKPRERKKINLAELQRQRRGLV